MLPLSISAQTVGQPSQGTWPVYQRRYDCGKRKDSDVRFHASPCFHSACPFWERTQKRTTGMGRREPSSVSIQVLRIYNISRLHVRRFGNLYVQSEYLR